MKLFTFLAIISLFVITGCQDDELDQRPDNIIETDVCPTLHPRILELFPEHLSVLQTALFADTVQKRVLLTKDTEVYVTYLEEGAGYRNSFGWYAYDKDSPPTRPGQIQHNVIFPDVSSDILDSGNRLKISEQTFKAGTVIGFFLVINGWQGKVDYDKPVIYTDYPMNSNKRQQHILFREKTCGEMVLAFEDNLTADETSDSDYNDLIFTVSDNNTGAMNTSFAQDHLIAW